MPQIRPISDLRNNFKEISHLVHESGEPVFLTKNGYGDMVVMSIEQYEMFSQDHRIEYALNEAQEEAKKNPVRYDFDEVSTVLRKKLISKLDDNNV